MNLWLDDVRDPSKHGAIGWQWAKTASAAISLLRTGRVERASLDHDLSEEQYPWNSELPPRGAETGYDVVCWLEENPQFLATREVSAFTQ